MTVNLKKKRLIGCQFKERVNQPPVIIHQTSLSQRKKKKGEGVGCWGNFRIRMEDERREDEDRGWGRCLKGR